MEKTPPAGPAQAVQDQLQQDAKALFQRLQQSELTDLTVHYTLEHSAVTLPAMLIRFLTLAVLFRWNSAKKWHAALHQKLLPEPLQTWLEIEDLAELAERATVDWMPSGVLLDTLAWQVAQCLTQSALPQPIAVIRQTIRDLLLREALVSEGGLVLNRNFWRRVAKKGRRPLSAGLLAECRQRIQFVLGQVDLAQVIEGRWLEIPKLEPQQRAKLVRFRAPVAGVLLQPLWSPSPASAVDDQGLAGDVVREMFACRPLSAGGRRFAAVAAVFGSDEPQAVAFGSADQGLCRGTSVAGDGIRGVVASVFVAGRTGNRDRFGLWYGQRRHACASADEIGCGGEASDAVAGLADRPVSELLPSHSPMAGRTGVPLRSACGHRPQGQGDLCRRGF